MISARSLQSRIFIAILLIVAIPGAIALGLGTYTLREFVSASGTAGPWDQVGESGIDLVEAVASAAEGDSLLAELTRRHRANLTESVTLSRRYAFIASRTLARLPAVVFGTALLIAALALIAARILSRSLSRPVMELVGWTQDIARGKPLPPESASARREVGELRQLRDALRSMAGELTDARQREIEAARLRTWTEMARRVAHELKNPLTPMRMAASTVVRIDDANARECGQVLLEEIDRLDEMARSFAQFGRLPEGPPAAIDMREMLESLAERYSTNPDQVNFESDGEVEMVHGHHDALLRVFRNLLVNAEEAGAPVHVRLHFEADGVHVSIRDSGPGIPDEILQDIWSPDFTTKRKGSGLGLPLVRQTVRAHGGSVHARSHSSGGAEFTVFLPTSAAAQTKHEPSDSAGP